MDDNQSRATGDSPSFVVVCEECEMTCRTDDLAEALDFSVNHQRHTGHDLSWERSTLVDGIVTIPRRSRWKVRCETCETERLFRDKEKADEFWSAHERYAGHTPDAEEKITLPELSEIEAEDVQKVLDYCFEQAESVDAIPTDAVITAFEQAGLTRKRAAEELAIAEEDEELASLGEGLLIR